MRFGSVCSGIEAASVAWKPLGWEAAWLAEIEPFPSAVLKHHYPDVTNLGDMTKLPHRIASGEIEAPDLFCGGTPCQAFSVAGLRKSLDDSRGNLSLTFCEIANAIDTRRLHAGLVPSIVFWENVPGVLSTKDNAFGCFLAGLAGEDDPFQPPGGKWTNAGCVYGPQRTVAWRMLDAQYFGVAQRRRRVFVIASAREGFDPAAVLFEFDGVRRDIAPSRQEGKVTPTISSSGTGVSRVGFNCEDEWFIETPDPVGKQRPAEVSSTLDAHFGDKQGLEDQHVNAGCPLFVPAQPISIHPHCIGRAPDAGPQGKEYLLDGSAYCMDSRGQPQAVVFHPTQDPISSTEVCHSIGANNNATAAVAFAQNQRDEVRLMEVAGALAAEPGAKQQTYLHQAMQVRRLTPVECERLQGFPDGYTNIPWRTYQEAQRKGTSYETLLAQRGMTLRGPSIEECPDGPRYKALGNSWAVPVVRWIGRRISKAIS